MVHFAGDWTTEQRATVLRAAERFESRHPDAPVPPGWKPWVCVAGPAHHRQVFSATRLGLSRVIVAYTAEELAEKMSRSRLDGYGRPVILSC
ncbi:hypothetical protein GQ464_000770 [Rhodocaloribacter litoris]|uniref:hypothetical protein n=1 Tax=Rhodocaloribacter litoris TaxID=2558931 RepID=UPI001420BA70|nr:hypothetical protein [Rhodocaloribacter litoris]QXD15516.1 hypothetical protein GQ464_000770 [Rhodocaloribacter litoris]GIV61128.1 MAG: hypothetical protein KatS3mg043_2217 [Rhodothermaceae bacterium]